MYPEKARSKKNGNAVKNRSLFLASIYDAIFARNKNTALTCDLLTSSYQNIECRILIDT
jgi:hypothetical protein